MYLKISLILFLFINITMFSQTKLGTVNSDFIIGKMPQMKHILKRVEKYAKQLDSSFQIKGKEYQTKVEAYKAGLKTMSTADKKAKSTEIITLENNLTKFKQNGAKMLQLQREQSMRPLYQKLSETIAEVAKANGYTQILTTNGNEFGYIDERFDITQLVLDKLGIK
ncbi:OmpH family outer membrane protein [Tenacibaculum maritimum]|uniref:OmpH family outer membrane protein n=2 Tax=Tenacibaculum maritimum TaxID=107401 RepID=UPI0012E42150|nr:OmpH family outer membrane protein [Tenacibaculum maritimum]CAA0151717.1 Outer membrane protein P18 [Tenacibaculum maritimum]CAA0168053.1 Outer membrane protein P18 [Tenacibaculum maritimum]CAA0182630.1 Outer membrane protein P18 [Tenacibaculum maritimum]